MSAQPDTPPEGQAPPPALQPIAQAFAEAKQKSEKAQQRAKDKADVEGVLNRKGEAAARAYARAIGMPDKRLNKIINDHNLARFQAEQEQERLKAPPPPPAGGDGGGKDGGGRETGGDDGRDGGRGWTPESNPVKALPSDCPVVPLGVAANGKTFYYLTPKRSLFEIAGGSHNVNTIRELFGHGGIPWLYRHFPKVNQTTKEQNGWKADRASESLIAACWARDTFNRAEVVREIGGWKDQDGDIVLHCGDAILWKGGWEKPGFLEGHLYPAAAAMMKPALAPRDDAERHAQRAMIDRLLTQLDSWNWQDLGAGERTIPYGQSADGSGHKLASLLCLGHAAAAKAGGALPHRPLLWLTGDTGSGKTTLQDLMKALQGTAMIKTSNTTGAGLWQALGQSSRPIAVDEAENEAGSRRMHDVIRLAREAATGGVILRGGAGHEGAQFFAQSTFSFSSIIIPPLLGQDISRMAVLELGSLKGAKASGADMREAAAMGQVISRRLVDGWRRWPATFEAYRAALQATGHDPRGCNQYGTLLAMADLIRFDECADADTIQLLTRALSAASIDAAQDRRSNAEAMLIHLTSTPVDAFRGGTRMTVAKLATIAAGLFDVKIGEGGATGDELSPRKCRDMLEPHGIFFKGHREKCRIILPNRHTGLARLFLGSQWETPPGTTGAWTQAMARLPKAEQEASSKLGGRGWSVPARVFLQITEEQW